MSVCLYQASHSLLHSFLVEMGSISLGVMPTTEAQWKLLDPYDTV